MSSRTQLGQAYFDLATMLDAGMPILRTLDIMVEGRQGYLKQIFIKMRDKVAKGCGLAEAMARFIASRHEDFTLQSNPIAVGLKGSTNSTGKYSSRGAAGTGRPTALCSQRR